MKSLIVYSSRTGNTKAVARAIQQVVPAPCDFLAVEDRPDPCLYEFIAIGYWVDKGEPDSKSVEFMKRVKEKKLGLFGTLGVYPDSDHAHECKAKAEDLVAGNDVLGHFLCQGKIDPRVLEMMEKMDPDRHPMTRERKERIEEARKHPDEADLSHARQLFSGIVEKYPAD